MLGRESHSSGDGQISGFVQESSFGIPLLKLVTCMSMCRWWSCLCYTQRSL
jgi:hypothetical protein